MKFPNAIPDVYLGSDQASMIRDIIRTLPEAATGGVL